MERTLYQAGLTPNEFGQLDIRTAFQVMRAARDRERSRQQHTAFIAAHIINYAGFRSERTVHPEDVIPAAFPREGIGPGGKMTKDRLAANYERHQQRLQRERRRKGQTE